MPRAALDPDEKVLIARLLAAAGVDAIETGFPASAESEIEATRRIVEAVPGVVLSVLARALEHDVDLAWRALEAAEPKRRMVNLFLATSPIHRQRKLDKTPAELLGMIGRAVEYARRRFQAVAFAPEDAPHTEPELLWDAYRTAIEAGATVIGVPDTLGVLTPRRARRLIRGIRDNVPNLRGVQIAVHFHDDLGLATANTLAALGEGARVAQCTVNGLGERAGNAALEELAMAITVAGEDYGLRTRVKTERLVELSRVVAELSGVDVAPNKAVVGANVFATAAGIHQDGLLKDRATYTPFPPELVGAEGVELVLGKHSGRAAFGARLRALGYRLSDEQVGEVAELAKAAPKSAWRDGERLLERIVTEVVTQN
ncbi:MAG: pyruvate carboxyltransferase [bacterium]|nr:pyruvate carboxyltransferase [bacterium]